MAQACGSAVVWMHFFWNLRASGGLFSCHPAFAFASEIIPVFSPARRSSATRLWWRLLFASDLSHEWCGPHTVLRVGMSSATTRSRTLDNGHRGSQPESRSSTGWPLCGEERIEFKTPMLFLRCFFRFHLVARPPREHVGGRAVRNWAAEYSSLGCTFSVRIRGRDSVSRALRCFSITGFRDVGKDVHETLGKLHSGCSSSGST